VARSLLIAIGFAALVAASSAVVAWVALDADVNRAGAVGQAAFAGAVLVVSATFGYLANQQSAQGIAVERQARWDNRIAATSLGDFKRPHLDLGSGYEDAESRVRWLGSRIANLFGYPMLGLYVSITEGEPPPGRPALFYQETLGNVPPDGQVDVGFDARAWVIEGADPSTPTFASRWIGFEFSYSGGFAQRVAQTWSWFPASGDWLLERLMIDPRVEGMTPLEDPPADLPLRPSTRIAAGRRGSRRPKSRGEGPVD
jgi:hypothetical protein